MGRKASFTGRLLQKSEVNYPKHPGEGKPRTRLVLRRPLWEVVDVGIWARAPPRPLQVSCKGLQSKRAWVATESLPLTSVLSCANTHWFI